MVALSSHVWKRSLIQVQYDYECGIDEKMARSDSAGCQEEVRPTQNRGDLVLSDFGSKHEHLLTYQCYGGQEEVRPTKEGVDVASSHCGSVGRYN